MKNKIFYQGGGDPKNIVVNVSVGEVTNRGQFSSERGQPL